MARRSWALDLKRMMCFFVFFPAFLLSAGCASTQCKERAPTIEAEQPGELAYTKKLTGIDNIQHAVDKVTAALATQGFGVVSDMDVTATMKKKLGADMTPYRILGACNPKLAFRALEKDKAIGLLLPCKVTVYQDEEDFVVSFARPQAMFSLMGDPELTAMAVEVDNLFHAAFDAIE